MRSLSALVVVLALVGSAAAAVGVDVIVVARPGFPAPAAEPRGRDRLVLVSSRYRDPAVLPAQPRAPGWAQRTFRGQRLQLAVTQPDTVLLAYGMDGNSARYLVAVDASTRKLRYALDFEAFGHPPGGGEYEPIVWAWERDGVLYVSHAHLTYASATRNRNGYVSAIRVPQGRLLWRSPALVANSRSFVVTHDLVVSGYGFTAERDFLYALDRRTGQVVDRLSVPTAPETIRLRDGRLAVRTYDHDLVVRLAP